MSIEIYTDGACRGNPGPGGWGALLRLHNIEKKIYGGESFTTNNRMELTAAIKALELLKHPSQVELYTDSQYVCQGMTSWLISWKKKGWKNSKREPVKNADLWQKLDTLAAMHTVNCHWIKAHNGHLENEIADALANQGIDELSIIE